ncbi:MAG: PilT/PilU family type 4a pilus ATPase [Coprobacillus sp.]
MKIIDILTKAVQEGAADIFIIAGQPVTFKVYGQLVIANEEKLHPHDTTELINEIYKISNQREMKRLNETGDDDFSFSVASLSRFRVSAYRQRGSLAAVIRVISFALPNIQDLSISQSIIDLVDVKKGLVLVSGPAGTGKSTTQACMIDHINKTQAKHIITLEDPIEHLHTHNKSIISQREISLDSETYVSGLRAALRQSPDVILLGEMRDYETISIALTAAETGHTVISTLHTLGAANTIDRIIDIFPANQQHQIATQLAMTLETVISQQLVPTIDGKLIPIFEVMVATPAIKNLIRENKIHQIDGTIASSAHENMISMDDSLLKAYQDGIITQDTALTYAMNSEVLKRKMNAK